MPRNPTHLGFVFRMPAIQVVFFCRAIGREPEALPMATVNLEAANCTSATSGGICTLKDLSCRLLKEVEDTPALLPIPFQDVRSAEMALKDGYVWGALAIPANFSQVIAQKILNGGNGPLNAHAMATLDQSNHQVTYALRKALHSASTSFVNGLAEDCQGPAPDTVGVIALEPPAYGPEEPNFVHFLAPGVIILIVFFLALALTGEIFIAEKKEGLLARARVAGVKPAEALLSHVVTQFSVLVIQAGITLFFILVVFSVPCLGSLALLVGLTLLQGTAGMCYGLMISAAFDDLIAAMQVSLGSFYPNLLLSGILWPVEGMPKWLAAIAWWANVPK